MKKISVIGAGLSGLYAAWSAASHGAEVDLYEKGEIGTKHNCGEMFTEIYNSVPEECKLNKIKTFSFFIRDGISKDKVINVEFGEDSPFIMTDKSKHELIMKKKCEDLGVTIYEKTKISSYIKDTKVIDASGVSAYKLSMGKAVDYLVKRYSGEFNDLSTAVFIVRDDMMGYSWFFPRGKDLLNIGEGVYNYRFRADLMKQEKNIILHNGGGLIPMPTMDEFYNLITDNKGRIRVGNAAGLVNPLLGGGEHLAVVSGILAGELMAKGNESKYYEALLDIVGNEMRIGISGYEFMKTLDIDTLYKLFDLRLKDPIDFKIFNNNIRSVMRKWITLPEITNSDLTNFIGE